MGQFKWKAPFIGQKHIPLLIMSLMLACCTNNKVDISKIQNINNKEAVAYFTEVGFNNRKSLNKWKSDMMVSISGNYEENDLKSIDEFAEVFNDLSNPVKMKRIGHGGNINIYFGEDSNLNPKGYNGLTWIKGPLFSNEITTVKILIATSLNTIEKRKIIHHELLHAIGLHDSNKEFGSYNMMGINLFKSIDDFEKQNQEIQSSKLDKWAIEILYDQNVEIGLKKNEFIKGIGI
jgi:hypothetical protein